MRISISHNSSYCAEIDQLQINGRKAVGGYAFTFTLKGNRHACETPLLIFNISLSLSTSEPIAPLIPSIPSSTQIVQCHQYPNSEQLHFETVLTREQINALEEHRQENDLKLNIGLRALTSSSGQLWPSFDCSDVIVPREQWLKALNASGFRQTFLFEVPVYRFDSDLSKFVLKAQEFIELGHYKDAVKQCRQIIEQIEAVRGDKQDAMAANKKSQNKQEREGMTVIERMLSMREQLKNICQLGAHGNEDFSRSQAKAVLGATLSILAEPTIGFSEFTACKESNEA